MGAHRAGLANGIPAGSVTVEVGDTGLVPQHLTAGQWSASSALPGVHEALLELRRQMDLPGQGAVDIGAALRDVGRVEIEVQGTTIAPGQRPEAVERMQQGHLALAGPEYPGFTPFSFAAHFVEVRVESTTRRARVVSVVDCGRVASPVTAASQVRGAVVWGNRRGTA